MQMHPLLKKVLKVLVGVIVIAILLSVLAEWASPSKEEVLAREQHEQELRLAKLKAIEEASKPASTADCPGTRPDFAHPVKLSTEWNEVNPKGCDFASGYAGGEVEYETATGQKFSPNTKVVGLAGTDIVIKARAKSGTAYIYYMLCPTRKGPSKGEWVCQPNGY